MKTTSIDTRQSILHVALKTFAEKGYAGASVQEIVDAARVSKPALYYHFKNKADLYRAIVDRAFEERLRLMREAAARKGDLAGQLTEIGAASFKFIAKNRELMRLAFASAFAARGEVPHEARCVQRAKCNLEFIRGLIQQAVARGELGRRFDAEELAMGFAGIMNFYVMGYLVGALPSLTARTAQRIVRLFLSGAQAS
ncbi:MAG: TetR/AcrR family transcriptional regulator [Verrucomicrobia bacterium]|nr:TetR/AcrR family transcriptional regulator [Verrucomicrobiota bacterium]